MGEIKIDIPQDMETAFEEVFPDEDKAAAILRLIRSEIARRQSSEALAGERSFEELVGEVMRLREEPPFVTGEDIRRAREELRK
jgi:hypothetical protein